MSAESSTSDDTDWNHIAPLLDEAVHRLSEADRRAILLRFFENKTHPEVARLLGVTQEAARKRTERALDRLRASLLRRGVRNSAASLMGMLGGHAVQGTPAGLGAALATKAVVSTASLTLFAQLLQVIKTNQLSAGLAAVALASVSLPLVLQHQTIAGLRAENQALEERLLPMAELEAIRAENRRESRRRLENHAQTTTIAQESGWIGATDRPLPPPSPHAENPQRKL